jgi:8-oxo-dGTP pyrophosphatase MutT (NUDIX family)
VSVGDGFFDSLIGDWWLEGTYAGRPLEQTVWVEEVLGGRFLRISYHPSIVTPIGPEPYAAIAYIGWDGGAYVMSLFDIFTAGAGPIGRGVADGDSWTFAFDYADGPFSLRIRKTTNGWDMEQSHNDSVVGVKRLRRPRMRKVWAFVTRGERGVMMLAHQNKSIGLQVPSGTLHEGESPSEGVLREAAEETGRDDFTLVGSLGVIRHGWGWSDSDIEGFHLRAPRDSPMSWSHGEFTNTEVELFSFFWVDIDDAERLLFPPQRDFIPELRRSLGLQVE